MFADFADLDRESLKSDMLGEVLDAWPKYDARRGASPGTFAYQVASRKLLDLHKVRCREAKRVVETVEPKPFEDDRSDLTEQLRSMMAQARGNFDRYGLPLRHPKANHDTVSRVQAAAILWLQRRERLSLRGTARVLADPDIQRAMGLEHAPSYVSVLRAVRAVTRINFSRKKLSQSPPGE